MYKVKHASRERWIFIDGEGSFDEPDAFVQLLKAYQSEWLGEIIMVSQDILYRLENDPLKLIFQWDSCFGITVIVPPETDILAAEKGMKDLCDRMNKMPR